VGFGVHALDASITVAARGALAPLGWAADASYTVDHADLTATREGTSRVYAVAAGATARGGYDTLRHDADGTVTLRHGERTLTARLTCLEELRFATPRDYLLGLVPP
jgi:hypothetical protein